MPLAAFTKDACFVSQLHTHLNNDISVYDSMQSSMGANPRQAGLDTLRKIQDSFGRSKKK